MVHTHLKKVTLTAGNASAYAPVHTAYSGFQTVQSRALQPMPVACTIRNLRVRLTTALAGADTRTIVLQVNGVDAALTVTLNSGAQAATDSTNSVSISANDTINWRSSGTDSPPGDTASISVDFEASSGTNVSAYGTGGGNTLGNTGSVDSLLYSDGNWVNNSPSLVATPGTITHLAILIDNAPGVGNTRVFTIHKNGVAQDGSGGTPDTRASFGAADTSIVATFSLSVVAGDQLTVVHTTTGTPSATHRANVTTIFSGSAARWNFGFQNNSGPSGTSVLYQFAHGSGTTNTYSTTESLRVIDGPATTFWLSGFQLVLTTAPGATRSWAAALRKGSIGGALSDTASAITISDAAVDGEDHDDRVEVTSGDQISVGFTPTNTPVAAGETIWAFVGSTSDPGPGEGGSGGSIPVFMHHYRQQGMI